MKSKRIKTEIKKGILPELVKDVSMEECIDINILKKSILEGKIVIPKNNRREDVIPTGIGYPLRTKVNANVGSSTDQPDKDLEVKKAIVAEEAGADTIMDLSTGGDIAGIRREILHRTHIPLGTVPIYQAVIEVIKEKGALVHLTEDKIFEVIEQQAIDGVDFMTLHCGVTFETFERLKMEGRVMDLVSRGGTFLLTWMLYNKKENPLYVQFDRILDIASEYDITLSLGDGFRPGAIADSSDRAQFKELSILGELTQRAWERDVQVMIEGPGHIPIDEIEMNVRMEKSMCHGAPFYVLGPLVTDVAPGYDHIVSAIGGALAASYGADFLCYVTPSEHLGIPGVNEVREGVIVSRIAAHAADIAKGIHGAEDWDKKMSMARKKQDWEQQFELAIDRVKAKELRERTRPELEDVCSMCGKYCAIKLLKEALEKDK
ncbi:phosphomethylpyrimidine synthase ThiC [candidate division WOR-3 bacterium]|nr:phosphomethylpyrimidine synthase ThiC [candidate division WOR-3 bacterium]MCK4528282.1 phosphomethylpyrimidine synthase ThiC [candidate division WOR-3 bacterium]